MNIQSTSYYKYSSHSHTALVSIILSHTHTQSHTCIRATQGSASCPMILRHVNWKHSYNNIWSSLINRCTLHDKGIQLLYGDVNNADVFIWLVSLRVDFGIGDSLDCLHTFSAPPKHSVLVVKPGLQKNRST